MPPAIDSLAPWRERVREPSLTALCVILEVSDTGPGIPSEERERVFDRFYRSPGNDVPTGSGLGLAIVKTVVEKHDGTVVLTEPSDHSGLLVRASLPAE